MLRFFAPLTPAGTRATGELRSWRAYVARVSSYLHTPLPAVMEMWWDDILLWHEEARMIHRETFGLLVPRATSQTGTSP